LLTNSSSEHLQSLEGRKAGRSQASECHHMLSMLACMHERVRDLMISDEVHSTVGTLGTWFIHRLFTGRLQAG
jgi:hypothetical protein